MPITEPAIEIETASPAVASVIWLHGLGADGYDFVPIVPELGLAPTPAVRFIFPHAPERPVTLNGGYVKRAWYDIVAIDKYARQDAQGIRASEQEIARLIAREIERGIAPARIVLAGFSQGGAMALHTGLRYPERLAGILALATYLPLHDTVESEISPANRATPIFMAHGHSDAVVPLALAQLSYERLKALGLAVSWHEYAMAHGVVPAEIADIGRWLQQRLSP